MRLRGDSINVDTSYTLKAEGAYLWAKREDCIEIDMVDIPDQSLPTCKLRMKVAAWTNCTDGQAVGMSIAGPFGELSRPLVSCV